MYIITIINILKKGDIHPIMKGDINVRNFEIEFYRKENGDCPFIEFLDSLDLKMRARILRKEFQHE